jgi:hypothetical protein
MARCVATVVLPDPPFSAITEIVCNPSAYLASRPLQRLIRPKPKIVGAFGAELGRMTRAAIAPEFNLRRRRRLLTRFGAV